MIENNIKITLNKIIFFIFTLFFTWVITSVLIWMFISKSTNKSFYFYEGIYSGPLNPYIVISGAVVLSGLLICLVKLVNTVSIKVLNSLIFIFFPILLTMQLIFACTILVNPQLWDFATVYHTAVGITKGYKVLDHYFFDDYPNNIGISLLLAGVFKAFVRNGQENYNYIGILFNIFMIDIGIALSYLTARKLLGIRNSAVLLFICLIFLPFITYVPIFYSDTISMPFSIGIYYCYLLSTEAVSKFRKYLYIILLSLLGTIGYILKPTIIIVVFALLINILLKYKFTAAFSKIAVIVLIISLGLNNYSHLIDQSKLIPIPYKQAGYPVSHWVMMGLKGPYGFYDASDVVFTESFSTKADRKEANMLEINSRIHRYGLGGLLGLFTKKVIFTWGDGTYFAPVKLNRDILQMTKFHEYLLPLENNRNYIYIYLSSIVQLNLLVLILFSGIYNIKSRKINILTVCNLTALGTGIFFMIWEARSRYLINISPLLILCSIDGLLQLGNSLLLNRNKELS